MSTQDFYSMWRETVERIARYVANDFPDVEEEDLSQDLYVAILEREFKRPTDPGVILILRKVAKDKAAQYRAQHLILSPQYNYRTSEVRQALEYVFQYEDWLPKRGVVAVDDEGEVLPVSRGEASYDLEETLTTHSDIKRAWERLPDQYKTAVEKRYRDGVMPENQAETQRLRHAIERLTDLLNSYYPDHNHDGPGSRRIVSNAHARYLMRQDYEL